MSKKLSLSLITISLAAAAVVYASPYYAVYQMKQAAQQRDAERLNNYVDFPVLRQNLQAAIDQKLQQTLQQTRDNNPFSGLAAGIAGKFATMMIDAIVTPQGLAAIVNGSKPELGKTRPATETDKQESTKKETHISYRYRGWSDFNVNVVDDSGKQTVTLNFQRHGLLNWKLNAITF